MNWSAEFKRIEASRKREERAALKRQRELQKALKEQAKLSAQEQARLEVAAYQNSIDVLLSVHKEASPTFDWIGLVAAIAPHNSSGDDNEGRERLRSLAQQVLSGDQDAYRTALVELSTFSELAALGSALAFRFHGPKLAECEVTVNGHDAIPAEVKSLTAAGKLSSKAMPKARFHEIYQDHVCGCVLRAAREIFALLPVDDLIVTASVQVVDGATGQEAERPVLSVAIPRAALERLDFARLDPSDSMESFVHRGDAVASRKSGEFVVIEPLHASDTASARPAEKLGLSDLLTRVRDLRADISKRLERSADSSASTEIVTPSEA